MKSTARLFGDRSRSWLQFFMSATVVLASLALILALAPGGNVLRMAVALGGPWAMGWHMAWQMRGLDTDDAASCLKMFRANRDAGLILALFLAAAIFL